MKTWIEDVIKNKVEMTTYEGYITNVNIHIIPYFREANIMIQDLTPLHFDKFFNYKFESGRCDGKGGLAPTYLKKLYYNMKQALDYAIVLNVLNKNPIIGVRLPKMQVFEGDFYSIPELEKLLEVSHDSVYGTAIRLAVNYGLRRGEILGLRWMDINFDEKYLVIRNTRVKVKTYIEKKPKSKSSLRRLPLIKNIEIHLKRVKKIQEKNMKLLGEDYHINDYVCKKDDGYPLSLDGLSKGFKRILIKNNLRNIRFHDLRHSTASYLAKMGFSLKEIQFWIGHSDITMTSKYTHLDDEMKLNMAKKVNKYFKEPG
jgi:integrase